MTLRKSTPQAPASNASLLEADRTSLERKIEDCLRRSGYLALRDVVCDTRGGIVRLRGCLPTHYLKQVAQATVAEVDGVRRIINRIVVAASIDQAPIGFDREEESRKSHRSRRTVRS
jgi:osmotically-inducible protein OsmY